jgi:glycosyltransferase involved in cell wall biosynthesis
VGVSGEDSALYRALKGIAKFLYRRCDRLVVVTPAFKDYLIANWGIRGDKISIVENGVETELFSPGDDNGIRHQFGLEGKFVVSYIGTLGMAHGLDTLLETAARFLSETSNVRFLVVGEGAEKEQLCGLADKLGLQNVIFVSERPRALIPDFIRASDACLVILRRREIFTTVIPTKLLEFMACARPVILGVEGQAREIVESAQAGLCIEPENVDALECAIRKLNSDPALRQRLGDNGREWVVENVSRGKTAGKYLEVLESVIAPPFLIRPDRVPERP